MLADGIVEFVYAFLLFVGVCICYYLIRRTTKVENWDTTEWTPFVIIPCGFGILFGCIICVACLVDGIKILVALDYYTVMEIINLIK